jgi:predicted transcriptional regulator
MPYNTTLVPNNIRKIRESKLLGIPDIVRRTGLSPSDIKRIEKGGTCRLITKRKILEALGIELEERKIVFPED